MVVEEVKIKTILWTVAGTEKWCCCREVALSGGSTVRLNLSTGYQLSLTN